MSDVIPKIDQAMVVLDPCDAGDHIHLAFRSSVVRSVWDALAHARDEIIRLQSELADAKSCAEHWRFACSTIETEDGNETDMDS